MSELLIVAGRLHNDLARGTVTATSENTLFPLSRLYDGKPSQDFRFNAAGVDDSITLDGDLLKGAGAFESGISALWTGSGGTFALDTGTKHSGAQSGKLTHSSSATRSFDYEVRSGETLNGAYALRGDGTASSKLYLINTRTGMYWTGSAWTATPTALDSQTTASFKTGTFQATAESYAVARVPVVTMRLTFELSASGSAWLDSTYVWPSWDFVSVHGHNLGPVTCQVRSSTDGFAASNDLEGSPTIYAPRFWHRLATPSTRRYRRLKFVGTNHEPIRLGEVVTSKAYAAAKIHEWGYELREVYSDTALQMPDGAVHVANVSEFPRLAFASKFFRTAAQQDDARRELFGRAQGRAYPLVLVPDDSRPEALFGLLGATWAATREFFDIYAQDDFQMTEAPFPRATS